jgi:hypothetical protein
MRSHSRAMARGKPEYTNPYIFDPRFIPKTNIVIAGNIAKYPLKNENITINKICKKY